MANNCECDFEGYFRCLNPSKSYATSIIMIITFILHNQNTKSIPNGDVSFANDELHQACGHVTLLMNT